MWPHQLKINSSTPGKREYLTVSRCFFNRITPWGHHFFFFCFSPDLILQIVISWISTLDTILPLVADVPSVREAWLKAARTSSVDTQVETLLGWYIAIILPCQGLITLTCPPTIHQCLEDGGLRGSGSCCRGWVNLLRPTPALHGRRRGGEEELSGGHSERDCCHCCGKITRGFIC